jgi:hypothetical protein
LAFSLPWIELRRKSATFTFDGIYMKTLFLLIILCVLNFQLKAQVLPPCVPVPSGLVDWWPADGNAVDIIGTNNGTIPYAGVTYAAGEVNEAWSFSGISPFNNDAGNEVDFGANVANFGTNDFTIDFWIKQPTNATSIYACLEKRGTCQGSETSPPFWEILIGGFSSPTPGHLSSQLFDVNSTVIVSSNTINDGLFHHVALVRQGETISFYIDGSLDSSNMITGGILNLNNSAVFRAGQGACVGRDGTEPFVGELDELDLFNRALSPAEIYAIYQAGSAGKCGTPPTILTQPENQVAMVGSNIAFTTFAAGSPLLSYQWSFNGTNILGVNSQNLVITNVSQTNVGTYAVLVSNAYGTATSSNAMLSLYPFIAVPFAGAVTYWGQSATLSVVACGTGPLIYQWLDNGVAITNATNATLTLTTIQAANAGLYSVVVTSPFGSVTNAPAQVIVEPAGVSVALYPGVTIQGVVGYNYTIQSTPNLTDTNSWVTLTNLTLTQPTELWIDTNTDASLPANAQRFYQVLPGQ